MDDRHKDREGRGEGGRRERQMNGRQTQRQRGEGGRDR